MLLTNYFLSTLRLTYNEEMYLQTLKTIKFLLCLCFRISYQLQRNLDCRTCVERPWHVGDHQVLVQLQGHVLCAEPEVQTTWKKGFLCFLYL
jgi:hypothetical protein